LKRKLSVFAEERIMEIKGFFNTIVSREVEEKGCCHARAADPEVKLTAYFP